MKKKTVIKIVSGIVVATMVAMVGISVNVGFKLTSPKRQAIQETPDAHGLKYEDITFKSFDDVKLKGWWIESSQKGSNKTVIFSHGYRQNRVMHDIKALNLAKTLHDRGYNVLMFDFRASGESGGAICTVGQNEKKDLLSAIKFAKEEKKSQEIDLIGWSMGAAVSILGGSESKDVNKIIADSPFSDLRDYLEVNLPVWTDLPSVPFNSMILAILPNLRAMDPSGVSPRESVENLDKEMLLIHSTKDDKIPYTESLKIKDHIKRKNLVTVWITDNKGHKDTYKYMPKEYEKRILNFLES